MANRETCREKLAGLSARTSVEAVVGIVIAGATALIFAMMIITGGRDNSDSPEAGKWVGLRHDTTSRPTTGDTLWSVSTLAADQGQEASSDTVVRNGVTVVSPPLLVPVIDADAMQTGARSEDGAFPRKRSHYAKRARTRREPRIANRWTAYGLTFR